MPIQPTMPTALITAAATKASAKCPVRSTMMPVSQGESAPGKLPSEFWIPTQRPEALGPARICDMAYMPGEEAPIRI